MEPILGQIIMFGGNFAPRGWASCDGQLLPISQNTALFSVIGTTYGGDGRVTFGLPDMKGRVPIHVGQGGGLTSKSLGQKAGAESVILTRDEMPNHIHVPSLPISSEVGTISTPTTSTYLAKGIVQDGRTKVGDANIYSTNKDSTMKVNENSAGGNDSHTNMQPYLVINYIIALEGIYPSRN